MTGLLGKKIGMTRIYDQQGVLRAVTVLQVGPCVVLQRKSLERDGYAAYQLGFESRSEKRATRPAIGHAAKVGAAPQRFVREFPAEGEHAAGDTVGASVFEGVSYVDITGVTKGKGFQGVVKRHGFRGGPRSHGSMSHRRPGSIGMCQTPGRVLKGQKLPGQTGARRRTVQHLRVLEIDEEKDLLVVSGAVPGPNGGMVEIRTSRKRPAAAPSAA